MQIEAFVQSVINGEVPPLPTTMSDEVASLASLLKAEADRHWRIDPHLSLLCADAIITIGETVSEPALIALGMMARGDALKLLNQLDDAWATLDAAGALYRAAGDEVGWARTRIGRVGISVQVDRVDEAMQDADLARTILQAHQVYDRLIILDINVGASWNYLGDYRRGRAHYETALNEALALGEDGQRFLGMIYTNLGYTEQGLGNLRHARALYESAYSVMQKQDERSGMAVALLNIASIAQAQGQFRQALALLYQALDPITQYQPILSRKARCDMVSCYVLLNRFEEARTLAQELVVEGSEEDDQYDRALVLMQLAHAEVALGCPEAADVAFERAQLIFEALGAKTWLAELYMRRLRLKLHLGGERVNARNEIDALLAYFAQSGEEIQFARASLLKADLEFAEQHPSDSWRAAQTTLKTARHYDLPLLRYEAHLLFGKIEEERASSSRALRHYRAAATLMERVQRHLTLTLRSDFLENKQDALRHMLRLYLAQNRAAEAFTALERAKSGVWLRYLRDSDRGQLPRVAHRDSDDATRGLAEEISELREAHYWFYRAAHDPVFRKAQHITLSTVEAAQQAAWRERRLRELEARMEARENDAGAIDTNDAFTSLPSVGAIQSHLRADDCLIAYYHDGAHLWAFTLTRHTLDVQRLPEPPVNLSALQDKLTENIGRALRAEAGSAEAAVLSKYARRITEQLYSALLAPVAGAFREKSRLIMLPYGDLHALPFHLLHDGDGYLIERLEVVILPTASLLMRAPLQQPPGALALSHRWDGRLPHTLEEAKAVIGWLGGERLDEEEACRNALEIPPRQVLHIAAHGQYRIDRPDLSYLHLADGALYTDELISHDLRYELVTLSACETGRGHVTAGDEVVGIGRGLLFAGARALIASLWRVNDALTAELMNALYRCLAEGASKAAALREAQLALLHAYPGLHPAFWGAFELIGNADPLSQFTDESR